MRLPQLLVLLAVLGVRQIVMTVMTREQVLALVV
jgi:hypothetical protein